MVIHVANQISDSSDSLLSKHTSTLHYTLLWLGLKNNIEILLKVIATYKKDLKFPCI